MVHHLGKVILSFSRGLNGNPELQKILGEKCRDILQKTETKHQNENSFDRY